MIEETLRHISDRHEFTPDEVIKPRTTSAHAFRHTFGMHAVRTMKLNSVREILGHESIDTTSIYSREEERQIALDAFSFFVVSKDAALAPEQANTQITPSQKHSQAAPERTLFVSTPNQ